MLTPPFQNFLDEHREDVYRFLVSAVGRQDADDCFQETFLSALRAYPELSNGANLRAWVLKIAHRKAIDIYRSGRRRPVPVGEVPEAAGQPAPERDEDLWNEVRRLPVKQRAAIVLRFANDLAHDDIGRVIGCSEEAARRNVHEGLTTLRGAWRR